MQKIPDDKLKPLTPRYRRFLLQHIGESGREKVKRWLDKEYGTDVLDNHIDEVLLFFMSIIPVELLRRHRKKVRLTKEEKLETFHAAILLRHQTGKHWDVIAEEIDSPVSGETLRRWRRKDLNGEKLPWSL